MISTFSTRHRRAQYRQRFATLFLLLPVVALTGSTEVEDASAVRVSQPAIPPAAVLASWEVESNLANVQLGFHVASAGDVNNDSFDDIVVGVPFYSNGQSEEGAIFVYHGSASGPSLTPNRIIESNQVGAQLGRSVGSAGDVNNDTFDDIIAGAMSYSNGQNAEGRAFVYHGSATGVSATPNWTVESNQRNAFFGHSVSGAGDVNNDAFDDVIVGAFGYDGADCNMPVGSTCDAGAAFIYHGSASGLSTTPARSIIGTERNAFFGTSVSGAGDVNNDNFDDVIVGAPLHQGLTAGGAAFVYHGSGSGVSASASWSVMTGMPGASFGTSVSSAGDVNNDNFDDVIVGAPLYGDGGAAFVYHGSGSGLSTSANWQVISTQDDARLGWSVASAGTLNGDAFDEVVIGAPTYDGSLSDQGGVFVWFGSASGLGPNGTISNADRVFWGEQAGSRCGYSAASAGSVNNDALADLVFGSPGYSNGQSGEGQVSLNYGPTSTPGATLNATILLQGPHAGDGTMSTMPLFQESIPLGQPFGNANFTGKAAEYNGVETVASVPANAVDWVIVSLRTGTDAGSEIARRPAFVLNNGSVVGLTGASLTLPMPVLGTYRVVILARNHLGVMSANPVNFTSGTGTINFTDALSKAYSQGGTAMKSLGDGRFGLFAADANADGNVTALDFNQYNVQTTSGVTGYQTADFNLDGNVTALDFNQYNANTTAGATSQVP